MSTDSLTRAVLLALFLCGCCAIPAAAAAPFSVDPVIDWQQLLGGNADDLGYSIRPAPDGGFYLLGSTRSATSGDLVGTYAGAHDLWVVKLDAAGGIKWQQVLGGAGEDVPVALGVAADGGCLALAQTSSSASGDVSGTKQGETDYWVVKLDASGGIKWQRLLGGSAYEHNRGDLVPTPDGGCIVFGGTNSPVGGDVTEGGTTVDCWVVKLAGTGAIEWQRRHGGNNGADVALSAWPTTDGGYIVLCLSSSSASGDVTDTTRGGEEDLWLVKLNAGGGIQWQELLGGSHYDWGRSVVQTADGGYILVADTQSSLSGDVGYRNHGGWDAWIVKVNGAGAIQWQRLLGGSLFDGGEAVLPTADGGCFVLASTDSRDGDLSGAAHGLHDIWLVRLGRDGQTLWQRLLGGVGEDWGGSLLRAPDGGVIILGFTSSSANGDVMPTTRGGYDLWFLKVDEAPRLRLDPGWNFVSVPAVLAAGHDTAGAVFAGVDTGSHSVLLYNASTRAWAPMTASTKVKPLDGIWIYSTYAVTIPLVLDANPQAVPPVKDLAAGWNAVGHASAAPATARDALSPVASKWSTLKGFDAVFQRYETAIVNGGTGDYSDYRDVLGGKGYWLYMREPGQLAGM